MAELDPTSIGSAFRFPLVVMDFEASALTLDSYPIEVGVAIATTPSSSIETWSSLIASAPDWDHTSHWDPDAERIHGISRWDLRQGKTAREVMLVLIGLVGTNTQVWCDGGHYDAHWLQTLAQAAGFQRHFELCDIGAAIRIDRLAFGRYLEALNKSVAPHRAGPDAERICSALITLIQE